MEVKNKTCIITGSAQGLGKAFAKILLDHGAQVCISDEKEETSMSTLEEFKRLYGEEKVCFVKCDVTDENQFNNLFKQTEEFFNVDCIDILVNNAGINTNHGWRKCMDVNIIGLMIGSDIAMERMKKWFKKGTIINIASMAGLITGIGEEHIGYSVSKHGVVALTRTLAVDFKYHDVNIKALCPAWTDTEFLETFRKALDKSKYSGVEKNIKMSGGMMSPDYVAKGFYKLVSECTNGAVMGVIKDTPFFIIPDYGHLNVIIMVIISKLTRKITGTDLVSVMHQKISILIFIIILFFISGWLF